MAYLNPGRALDEPRTEPVRVMTVLTFYDFLYEVGMFEEGQNSSNKEFQQKAKERYLTALRCEIKSSGVLLIKRTTQDIFTNNFNKVSIKYTLILVK